MLVPASRWPDIASAVPYCFTGDTSVSNNVPITPLHANPGCASVSLAGLLGLDLPKTAETRFTVAGISLESGMNRQSSKLIAFDLARLLYLRGIGRDLLPRVHEQQARSVSQGARQVAGESLNEADTRMAPKGRHHLDDPLSGNPSRIHQRADIKG